MARGGLVGEVHRFFEVGAALRSEAADFVGKLASLVAGHAIDEQARGASEGNDADFILRLKFGSEDFEGFAHNLDAIAAFH
jgi:hypothetical protein